MKRKHVMQTLTNRFRLIAIYLDVVKIKFYRRRTLTESCVVTGLFRSVHAIASLCGSYKLKMGDGQISSFLTSQKTSI